MGTQPRDLLMAWLSFLAGDFCEEGQEKSQSGGSGGLFLAGRTATDLTILFRYLRTLFLKSLNKKNYLIPPPCKPG